MRTALVLVVLFMASASRAQSRCDTLATLLQQMIVLYDPVAAEQDQFVRTIAEQHVQIDSLTARVERSNYATAKAR